MPSRRLHASRPALARQLPRVRSAQAPINEIGRLDRVFLAPSIQSAILNGRLYLAKISRIEDQHSIPLSQAV